MTRYYISANNEKGFIEVSEEEFTALLGTDETRPYASKVYRGELTIEEVPTELREAVQSVVDNKIAKFGEYNKQEVPASEFIDMIEEVL